MTATPSGPPPGATARVSPDLVCRIAGLPVRCAEELGAPRSLELTERILAAEARLRSRREEVSALLHDAVGATADRKRRNLLLKLRRTLYNLRPASREALSAAREALSPGAFAGVADFQAGMEEREGLRAGLERTYREETARARERFREALRDPDFRKGLLVSSPSLHASLGRYAAAGEALRGKDEKTERGLLRYFTRTAMKATPFSTLCAVVPARVGEEEGPAVGTLRGDPRAKRSFVRINKMLYGVLREHLRERPAVRRCLAVEPNPTLRREEGRLVFLSAVEGREVFQRLGESEVLDLVLDVLRTRAAPTYGELVGALSADPEVEATEEEAAAYLDRLLQIGFLRFRTGIRAQEADWDLPLRAFLDTVDDEHAREVSALLAELREKVETYVGAGVEERATILAQIAERVESALRRMEVRSRPRKPFVFYEDATADAVLELPRAEVERAAAVLADFAEATIALAWPRPEQATMRHFFDTFYGGELRSVPLLRFYEDFYREHFKAHLEKEQGARTRGPAALEEYELSNPYGLELVHRILEARTRVGRVVHARWAADPDAEELGLTREEVEGALEGVEPHLVGGRSLGAFSQLVPPLREGGPPGLLLHSPGYTAGYGKFFSRFLYMLPEELWRGVRERNGELTDGYLAEICGDGDFNANLHPPLLAREISYPTGEGGIAEEQLPSPELVVERDPEDAHALCLRHAPSGKRVVPVDLGFQNPRMRPPLYQLLSRFTRPMTFAVRLPEWPFAAPAEDAAPAPPPEPEMQVIRRPRIAYGGSLVLARRRWTVPDALFPHRLPQEDDCAYFERVQRWRAEHGIPREAYVRLHPLPSGGTPAPAVEEEPGAGEEVDEGMEPEAETPAEGEPRTHGSRDLYKPQYVDFASPLLVGLFGKMVVNLRRFRLVVEERFPSAEGLPRAGGDAYAAEVVFQVDFPEGARVSPVPCAQEEHALV